MRERRRVLEERNMKDTRRGREGGKKNEEEKNKDRPQVHEKRNSEE